VLFICFLNWTEQGAKAVKGVPARHENLKAEIAQLGGRVVGGYVGTVTSGELGNPNRRA
jgi:uncharacterized protein with GYD domain